MIGGYKRKLETSLDRMARVMSSRYGLSVYYRGDSCFTDNQDIYLPSIPEDCSQDLYEAIQGFLDHEVAHIINEDFMVYGMNFKDFEFDEMTTMWFKALSDVRTEFQMGKKFPGSKLNLQRTSEWVVRNQLIPGWDGVPELRRFMITSILYGQKREKLVRLLPDGEKYLEQIEPLKVALDLVQEQPDVLHVLSVAQWIVETLGSRSSGASVPEEIEEKLKISLRKFKEKVSFSTGGSSRIEVPAKDVVWDVRDDPGDDEEDAFFSSEDEVVEDSLGEEEREVSSSLLEVFDVDPLEFEKTSAEIEQETAKAITRGVSQYSHYKKSPDFSSYRPYTTENDKVIIAPDGDKKEFLEAIQKFRSSSGNLVRPLRSVLKSRSRSVVQYDKTSGQLNSRALPRFLMTGNNRVFKRKKVGEIHNCRMCLLIDQSGSMFSFGKIEAAKNSAILFGEFCDFLSIPFEVLGFTTGVSALERRAYASASEEDKGRFTRWGSLEMRIYKQFFEKWRTVGHRLMNLKDLEHNYDGEAVMIAAKRLLLAREKKDERLIIITFSDGMPEQGVSCCQPYHQNYLSRVVKEVTESGIECVGIGICTDAVKRYYPSWITIDDPSHLDSAQVQKLKELFLEKKRSFRGRLI